MSDDTDNLRKTLNTREAQTMLRQFVKGDGERGNNSRYVRGHEFNFKFTQDERDDVTFIMDTYGQTFEEAFDNYKQYLADTLNNTPKADE